MHPILKNDHAADWLGVTVEKAEYGDAVLSMELREEMLNGFGIAHGGMIFALADTAFAMACNDPTGDGSTITVASGVDINFLRPAQRGQRLTAHARVLSQGRSGLYDVTVTADDGTGSSQDSTVIAQFRGRSRTIPNPASSTKGTSA